MNIYYIHLYIYMFARRCTAHARGVVGGSNRVYEWEFTRLSILIVKRSTDSAVCSASLKTKIKKKKRSTEFFS